MMAHFKHYFPSWTVLLIVVIALPIVLYTTSLLDTYTNVRTSQDASWALLDLIGNWRYLAYLVVSLFGMFYMARLDQPLNIQGGIVRAVGSMGLIFYVCSIGNPALTPVASAMILIAFVLGIRQISTIFVEHRKKLIAPYKIPWGLRLLISLVSSDGNGHDKEKPPI